MKFEFNLPNDFWAKIVLIHWWDSNILRSLYIKYELNWSSGFRGEDVWKCWRTDGCWGRMTVRAWVTGILLAHPWAFGSGELKMLGLKLWKFIWHQFLHLFWVLKRTFPLRLFFWVPKPYVLVENMKSNFELHFVVYFYHEAYYCLDNNNFIAINLHGTP